MPADANPQGTAVAVPVSDFQRIGGAPTVRRAVDRFYQLVLADPQLASYFEGMDIDRIKGHQAALLTQVLGGPGTYEGRDLAAAHRRLRVTAAHYARVGRYLCATLSELGASVDVVLRVGEVLDAVRPQIVAEEPAAAEAPVSGAAPGAASGSASGAAVGSAPGAAVGSAPGAAPGAAVVEAPPVAEPPPGTPAVSVGAAAEGDVTQAGSPPGATGPAGTGPAGTGPAGTVPASAGAASTGFASAGSASVGSARNARGNRSGASGRPAPTRRGGNGSGARSGALRPAVEPEAPPPVPKPRGWLGRILRPRSR